MKRVVWLMISICCIVLVAGCGALMDQAKESNTTAITSKEAVKMAVPSGIPVLMYHKIGPEKDNDAVLSEKNFKEQMQFLKDNGYHPITMDQLYAYVTRGEAVPEKPVLLSFDDGYADTYTIVYPLLKELGFPSVVFVNPSDVGTRLTWDQLREMKEGGMTISNHGYRHVEMGTLSKEEQKANIMKGQEALKKELGIDNPWFCYPYGDVNTSTEQIVKDSGIKMAFGMKSGWAHMNSDPYYILRVWIGNAVDVKHFEERLNTAHYSDV